MAEYLHHIPPAARSYVQELAGRYAFAFRLRAGRVSKLGDFVHNRRSGTYRITVNRELNPYHFLLTLMHELAHLIVAEEHSGRIKSHGPEWQRTFSRIMQPLLVPAVFPVNLLPLLKQHLHRPPATAASDPALWLALQAYDPPRPGTLLGRLPAGARFVYRKKTYTRNEMLRTRVVCTEVRTGRQYMIPAIVRVEEVPPAGTGK